MRDELLAYYERELTFLRRSGAAFAEKYPAEAARLRLEPTKCDDPHVERLLEGFAFLAARVHLRIDDDFSEVSEALLNVVFPNYLRPIPGASIVQFKLDPDQGKLTTGFKVPKGSVLHARRPIEGIRLPFQTSFPETLWPISVAKARWTSVHDVDVPRPPLDAEAALVLDLATLPDVPFESLEVQSLRFHLSGEASLTAALYEALMNNVLRIVARDPAGDAPMIELPVRVLEAGGFGPDESLLPQPARAFDGYRFLTEYFALPSKFMFVELGGLEALREAGYQERAEIVFLMSELDGQERRRKLESGVSKDTVRLGCVPVVNVYDRESEPIRLEERRTEYTIVPDARRGTSVDIFSVNSVTGTSAGSKTLRYEPFYGLRHRSDSEHGLYWYARRRSIEWRPDPGHNVSLAFVDLSGRPAYPDMDTATASLSCHNGSLPNRMPVGERGGDLTLEGGGPIAQVEALTRPTEVVYPPAGTSHLWRLISMLSLNLTTLADDSGDAIRELLRVHDFAGSPASQAEVDGLSGLVSHPNHSRIRGAHGLTFARGQKISIEFDEQKFGGRGPFLLASVLERFLGHAVSLNSFSEFSALSRQRKGLIKRWPPRAGRRTLL